MNRGNAAIGVLVLMFLATSALAASIDRGAEVPGKEELLETGGILDVLGLANEESAGEEGSLPAYLRAALTANPRLWAVYSNYLASMELVSVAGSLPDPKLGLTGYLQSVETRVGPQQKAVTLSQSFPWFGTLGARSEVKRAGAEAVRHEFLAAALKLGADVKTAYFNLGYLQTAIDVTGDHVELLGQWESVARARYAAGEGNYADVIKAQVELGVLSDRHTELQDRRRPLVAALNALLDRPSDSPIVVNNIVDFPQFELSPEHLQSLLTERNPSLAAWSARADSWLMAERVVRKEGKPSFTVGVNYVLTGESAMSVEDSGKDAFMATIGLSLPVWRAKYDAGALAATARYGASSQARAALLNDLSASLENAIFAYRDAVRKMGLYRYGLLPKGRQALGAARAAYEAGSAGFLDLVDAERQVLEFELNLARARSDALIQQAMIEMHVAARLDADAGAVAGSR